MANRVLGLCSYLAAACFVFRARSLRAEPTKGMARSGGRPAASGWLVSMWGGGALQTKTPVAFDRSHLQMSQSCAFAPLP